MAKASWVALMLVGCSSSSGGALPAPDAGRDGAASGLDGGAGDAGSDATRDASSDAAPLPSCEQGKTCALPLTCDPSDLLCEPPCDAMHACAAGSFCRPSAPGSPSGHCVGPDYQCLSDVPPLPAPTVPVLTLVTTFVDSSSGAPVPAAGLTVSACAKTDATCAAALSTGSTTTNGTAELSVSPGTTGFDGYFDVRGPSVDGSTIVETLVFSSLPIVANGNVFTATVESAAALQKDVAALGTLDGTRAQVLVVDDACSSTPAFGASLGVSSADGSTRVGYVGPSGVVPGATTFPATGDAVAYVLDVPGATTTLTTTYGGQTVNALEVVLRPGMRTIAYLAPSPQP